MKVAIQGNEGSYSHIAVDNYFKGKEYSLVECSQFLDVFDALRSEEADTIVVPIENSTFGSIYQNYDLLTETQFPIVGEIYLKINFYLSTFPGVAFEDIQEAYIHPVAMGQIQSFIKENPQIKFHEFEDTAGALKMIRDQNMLNAAGAASKFAAKYYGMQIAKENIQENSKNYTRFYVIRRQNSVLENQKGEEYKTTIEFELGEEAGSLYKTLRCFADRDIALTKIESRPIMNTDWQYRFYVDVLALKGEQRVTNALREVADYATNLRILGTYKEGKYIDT